MNEEATQLGDTVVVLTVSAGHPYPDYEAALTAVRALTGS